MDLQNIVGIITGASCLAFIGYHIKKRRDKQTREEDFSSTGNLFESPIFDYTEWYNEDRGKPDEENFSYRESTIITLKKSLAEQIQEEIARNGCINIKRILA